MVNYKPASLDRTFSALSDATRRGILTRLSETPGLSVKALAGPLPMSLPAVMKHLDVLAEAGLIRRVKTGRTVTCSLTAEPLGDAMAWIAHYRRFWTGQFDRLAKFLEDEA